MNIPNLKAYNLLTHLFSISTFKLIRYSHSNTKVVSPITQAVFDDKIHKIDWSGKSEQLHKWNWMLNLKEQKELNANIEWLQAADIEAISTSLQFIWNMSHKYQKYLVQDNIYMKILSEYYSRINTIKINTNNKMISPHINFKYYLPNFIYTDNRQVRSILKMRQPQVFKTLFKSRTIKIHEFIKIFPANIYNISDWPQINQFFFQHLYSVFEQLGSMADLQIILEYLSNFNQVSNLLVNKFVMIMNRQLQSNTLSLDTFLSMCNCAGIILFKSKKTQLHKLIQAHKDNQLLQLCSKLMEKQVLLEKIKYAASQLFELNGIRQIESYLCDKVEEAANIYLKQQQTNAPQLVKGILTRHRQLIETKYHFILQSVQVALIPKIIRGILVNAYLRKISLSDFTTFLNCQPFHHFILKYPCYPDLFKEVMITISSLNVLQRQKIILPAHVVQTGQKIDHFLNVTLKNQTDEHIAKHFYQYRQVFQDYYKQQLVWNMSGQPLVAKIALTNDYSFNNILGMLKHDSNFIYTRFDSRKKEHFRDKVRAQQRIKRKQHDLWEYPQYFGLSFSMRGRKHKLVFQDELLKNYESFYLQKAQIGRISCDSSRSLKRTIYYLLAK